MSLRQNSDSFTKSVILSIAAHILIFLAFTINAVFFKSEPLVYEKAIRIDILALPDKITSNTLPTEEPIAPAVEESTQEEPIPEVKEDTPTKKEKKTLEKKQEPNAIDLNKRKKKQQDAMKKISDLLKKQQAQKQDQFKKNIQKLQSQFKGNQITKGSDLTGVAKLEHEAYLSNLEGHIKQYWALPQWLSKQKLKAQVIVKFDENGRILSKAFAKTSGNKAFDDAVMESIDRSLPFPKPPEKLQSILKYEGILLGFPE